MNHTTVPDEVEAILSIWVVFEAESYRARSDARKNIGIRGMLCADGKHVSSGVLTERRPKVERDHGTRPPDGHDHAGLKAGATGPRLFELQDPSQAAEFWSVLKVRLLR